MKYLYSACLKCALVFLIAAALAQTAAAQRRDHLTKEEIELVRDVQEVDLRMSLFVNAIKRRLWSLSGVENLTKEQAKRIEKDFDKWGEIPKGPRGNLVADINRILNEAIDKFEDVYDREPESPLIPFAYYVIADYCTELTPSLESLASASSDPAEIGPLKRSADDCRNILDARDQVPRPTGKRPKSKVPR